MLVVCCCSYLFAFFATQVETLAEAGSYEDALSLCAMCKVRRNAVGLRSVLRELPSPPSGGAILHSSLMFLFRLFVLMVHARRVGGDAVDCSASRNAFGRVLK